MEKVSQIKSDGSLVLDYDSSYTRTEIFKVLQELFGDRVRKDRKQFIVSSKVALLVKNITFLGHSWTADKKRMQLPDYYPKYVLDNSGKGLQSVYLGIYHYRDVRLYVVYDPNQFIDKKSHNSSAHVNVFNLQYAQLNGYFSKRDRNGNDVRVYKKDGFVDYISRLIADEKVDLLSEVDQFLANCATDISKFIPKKWNAIECMKEMRDAGFNNYRQNRWEGWYFEFLVQKYLKGNPTSKLVWHNDKTKEGIDFDMVISKEKAIYLDLKTHSSGDSIMGNAIESFEKVVEDHDGRVYYLCLDLKAEKDSDHGYVATKFWNTLRDHPETDEEKLINESGKNFKYSVEVVGICLLSINRISFEILKQKPFNQGHNSDGKPRKPKVNVAKKYIDDLTIYYQDLTKEK